MLGVISMGEVLFFLALTALLVGPPMYFRRWWWTGTMGGVVALVLIAEAIAVLATQHTLSQMFWSWSIGNKWEAWLTIGCWSLAWTILMFHLGWKMIKPRRRNGQDS